MKRRCQDGSGRVKAAVRAPSSTESGEPAPGFPPPRHEPPADDGSPRHAPARSHLADIDGVLLTTGGPGRANSFVTRRLDDLEPPHRLHVKLFAPLHEECTPHVRTPVFTHRITVLRRGAPHR